MQFDSSCHACDSFYYRFAHEGVGVKVLQSIDVLQTFVAQLVTAQCL